MVAATDWQRRVHPLDARDATNKVLVVTWLAGSDDEVAIDLAAQLDVGEAVTNPVVTVAKLRAAGETEDEDVTAAAIAAARTIVGTVVVQRLHDLEAGRYYRVKVLHGDAGNRRGASLLVHCPE